MCYIFSFLHSSYAFMNIHTHTTHTQTHHHTKHTTTQTFCFLFFIFLCKKVFLYALFCHWSLCQSRWIILILHLCFFGLFFSLFLLLEDRHCRFLLSACNMACFTNNSVFLHFFKGEKNLAHLGHPRSHNSNNSSPRNTWVSQMCQFFFGLKK